jgi:hypothetical protein
MSQLNRFQQKRRARATVAALMETNNATFADAIIAGIRRRSQ